MINCGICGKFIQYVRPEEADRLSRFVCIPNSFHPVDEWWECYRCVTAQLNRKPEPSSKGDDSQ